MVSKRKYPIGAHYLPKKGVDFRVWAPGHKKLSLVLENVEPEPLTYPMKKEEKGYFSYFAEKARPGTYYHFRLSGSHKHLADPASCYQPLGPAGPSCVVDPTYPWKDKRWPGVKAEGQVIYEMHIGTFTQDGTFEAAAKELHRLADLGITLIEIMPLADFPGNFGWGYDGVNHFAPSHLYGKPDDLKRLIDQAHHLGIGALLDVVYNHLGPSENHLIEYSKEYLIDTRTDWGQAVNFDVEGSRAFFLANARYWIEEFHFDGLRIDATPWIFSTTPTHFLEELSRTVKAAGGKRKTLIVGENEQQNTHFLRPYHENGYAFDMLWNDDFHHTAFVRLTGKRGAYCSDYLGSPQEFISSFKYGFLYMGQYYSWQEKRRGIPHFNIAPESMVIFLENHDQVANLGGERLHQKTDLGNYRALTALFLLSPQTPLIFQGQEFNSSQPFHYFAEHSPELNKLVRKGRKKEMSQFPQFATKEMQKKIPNPDDPQTFITSKLKRDEIDQPIYHLYRDLLKLRKGDPVFKDIHRIKIDGAVLGPDCFVIRYFGEKAGDRLLIINFGSDFDYDPCPEPLLAPSLNTELEVLWASEWVIYGGEGVPPMQNPTWKLLGHSATLFKTNPLPKDGSHFKNKHKKS